MLCAFRNGRKISKSDLGGYLNSLLHFDNVGVFLGAGASVSAGGFTMSDIWDIFENNFTNENMWLRNENYYNVDSTKRLPNIENIFSSLETSIMDLRRKGDPGQSLVSNARSALCKSLILGSLLNTTLWKRLNNNKFFESDLKSHRDMLEILSTIRKPDQNSPWIFTTNYDLSVEWAAESLGLHVTNGFSGISSRKFMPQVFNLGYRNVRKKNENDKLQNLHVYLAKLHGSLTWRHEGPDNVYELQASEAWDKIMKFLGNTSNDLPFIVLPTALKYIETAGKIYSTLFLHFNEFLNRDNTVLFISGYGFGDGHINEIIKLALSEDRNFHLVISFPEFENFDNTENLPSEFHNIIKIRKANISILGKTNFSQLIDHWPNPNR